MCIFIKDDQIALIFMLFGSHQIFRVRVYRPDRVALSLLSERLVGTYVFWGIALNTPTISYHVWHVIEKGARHSKIVVLYLQSIPLILIKSSYTSPSKSIYKAYVTC
jgi:hypothetical protein